MIHASLQSKGKREKIRQILMRESRNKVIRVIAEQILKQDHTNMAQRLAFARRRSGLYHRQNHRTTHLWNIRYCCDIKREIKISK